MVGAFSVQALLAMTLAGLNIVNILYTWWRTRDQNVETRFNDAAGKLDALDRRVSAAEQTLRGMPAITDLHALQLSLSEIRGEMRTITAVMEGQTQIMERLERIVARHEDHLLDGAKG